MKGIGKAVGLGFKGFRFWRKHEIGKRILGTYEPKTEQTSERIEYEAPEVKVKTLDKLKGLRTSTKSGAAGVVSFAVLAVIAQVAPELPTAGLEEWITAVVMYLVARWSRTPEKVGLL